MMEKLLASLESWTLEELVKLRERLDSLIVKKENKIGDDLGKRSSRRARVTLAAEAELEREKEFFYKAHKITIQEMSVGGLSFIIPTTVIEGDMIAVFFRSPSTGEKKIIDCQAVRVREINRDGTTGYEVAAKAVDKSAVQAYREMLKKRGK